MNFGILGTLLALELIHILISHLVCKVAEARNTGALVKKVYFSDFDSHLVFFPFCDYFIDGEKGALVKQSKS